MIEFNHVSKTFDGQKMALVDLHFNVGAGELVFLTGHSGAGKTTVLKLLIGSEKATSGNVIVGNQDVGSLKGELLANYRRRVGIVFQDASLEEGLTDFENVALPLHIAGFPRHDIMRRVNAALGRVDLMIKRFSYPAHLSEGEQQRIGIARAIVHRPVLLVADEPTGNLDPDLSARVMRMFTQFQQLGVTVLIATHEKGVIDALPYRKIVIENGRLVDGGHDHFLDLEK